MGDDDYKIIVEDSYFFAHGPYDIWVKCRTPDKIKQINKLKAKDRVLISFKLYQEKLMYEGGKPFETLTINPYDWEIWEKC